MASPDKPSPATLQRLCNSNQKAMISQADQDALAITRRDHETVGDALRRCCLEQDERCRALNSKPAQAPATANLPENDQ